MMSTSDVNSGVDAIIHSRNGRIPRTALGSGSMPEGLRAIPRPLDRRTAFVPISMPPISLRTKNVVHKAARVTRWPTCCSKPAKNVTVLFLPEGVHVQACPGEPLATVAMRGGVEIVQECGVGECGTCEVYLVSGDKTSLVRSCVEPTPCDDVLVDALGLDIPPV